MILIFDYQRCYQVQFLKWVKVSISYPHTDFSCQLSDSWICHIEADVPCISVYERERQRNIITWCRDYFFFLVPIMRQPKQHESHIQIVLHNTFSRRPSERTELPTCAPSSQILRYFYQNRSPYPIHWVVLHVLRMTYCICTNELRYSINISILFSSFNSKE